MTGPALQPGSREMLQLFAPTRQVYLDTATYGLPPTATLHALVEAAAAWWSGTAAYEEDWEPAGEACRELIAPFLGGDPSRVALMPAVSVAVALVGATLDARSVVLIPDGEFASLSLPLVAAAGLAGAEVRTAPFTALVEAIDDTVTLVATSHVRSNGGATQDLPALAVAAHSVGARILVDASHSAGILPLDADRLQIDYVVAAAYKHLLCPRGVAFLHLGEEARVPPALTASWRGLRPGADFFTTDVDDLADGATGLDVSLAWHPWAGARCSLELLGSIGAADREAWCVGLATKAAVALGLEPTGSSVLGVPTVDSPQTVKAILSKRSIAAAVRAGEVRISFHVYNTDEHVEEAVDALRPLVRRR